MASPATMPAPDWRTQLDADYRERLVNKIAETLKRYIPFSGEEEIKKIAMRFEETMYTAATSQSDYLRNICLKMLPLETKSQNPMANSLQINAANKVEPPYQEVTFSEPHIVEMESRKRKQDQTKTSKKIPKKSLQLIERKELEQKNENEDKEFISHCRPQSLCKLIHKLSDQQKEDVRTIGFGGLLTMSLKTVPSTMFRWLVENFNGHSRMLRIDDHTKLVLTPNDICDVFTLPIQEHSDVLELSREEESLPFTEEWKQNYGIDINKKVALHKFSDLIENRLMQGGDDFKRFFVLYSLSSFLTPVSNRMVDFKPIKSLVDVAKIASFNWCGFVLSRLCRAVQKFNSNPQMKNFNGCWLVLQILYLHRLKWQGRAEPSTLPLIQHWDGEKLRSRIKEEEAAAAYGQGEWDFNTYPVTHITTSPIPKESSSPKIDIPQFESSATQQRQGHEEILVSSSRFIKFELPENELDDSQIDRLATDEFHKVFLQVNRDIAVITNVNLKRLEKEKRKMEENKASNLSSQIPVESESQKFFSKLDILKCMDEIVEKVMEMKRMMANPTPSFELLMSPSTADNK